MSINLNLVKGIHQAINAAQAPHGEVLDALMTVYANVLMQFPCCFDGAEAHIARLQELIAGKRAELANAAQAVAAEAILKAAGHGPATH